MPLPLQRSTVTDTDGAGMPTKLAASMPTRDASSWRGGRSMSRCEGELVTVVVPGTDAGEKEV
jgi:hypothetical protein